jgi:hypothetical protein
MSSTHDSDNLERAPAVHEGASLGTEIDDPDRNRAAGGSDGEVRQQVPLGVSCRQRYEWHSSMTLRYPCY